MEERKQYDRGKVAGLAAEARSLGMDKKEFVRMAEEQFGGEETV